MRNWTLTLRALLLAVLGLLVACGSKPPPKIEIPTDQILLSGQIAASADVNPDPGGVPAPVLVRVYELASDDVFNRTDFFSLFDHEQAVLGAALLRAREFQLVPGQVVDISGQVEPRTQFIGAIAAVRDLDAARWRATAPLPGKTVRPSEPHRVEAQVAVGRGGVTIALGAAGTNANAGAADVPR
ncbi:MAG: type VI secretion system lipoprotein TssJ [Gammaproteobacteria bacterium]|nr:type VI secretion system lipoprotein TssJ [Gammaproteobacteria bacterium]